MSVHICYLFCWPASEAVLWISPQSWCFSSYLQTSRQQKVLGKFSKAKCFFWRCLKRIPSEHEKFNKRKHEDFFFLFFFLNLSGWKCLQNRCVAEGNVMRAREVVWRLGTIQEPWRPWKQTDNLTCVREWGGRELYRWMGWWGPGAFWVDVQHHFEWDYVRLEKKT